MDDSKEKEWQLGDTAFTFGFYNAVIQESKICSITTLIDGGTIYLTPCFKGCEYEMFRTKNECFQFAQENIAAVFSGKLKRARHDYEDEIAKINEKKIKKEKELKVRYEQLKRH